MPLTRIVPLGSSPYGAGDKVRTAPLRPFRHTLHADRVEPDETVNFGTHTGARFADTAADPKLIQQHKCALDEVFGTGRPAHVGLYRCRYYGNLRVAHGKFNANPTRLIETEKRRIHSNRRRLDGGERRPFTIP